MQGRSMGPLHRDTRFVEDQTKTHAVNKEMTRSNVNERIHR